MKIFLSFLVFSLSLKAFSQPVLNQANCAPQAGQSYSLTNINYVNQGSAGANQIWDLSSATVDSVFTVGIYSVNGIPPDINFPNANIKSTNSNFNGYIYYYKIDLNKWEYYGFHTTISVAYSNPRTFLPFPFTYSDAHNDSCYGVLYVGYNIYKKGTVSIEADGYGSLILPSGTYNNVLRVHYVEQQIDSSQNGVYNTTLDYYYWFKPDNHYPIAYMMTSPNSGGFYLNNISSVEDLGSNSTFNIYPNPANTYINITYSGLTPMPDNYEIIDASGKVIAKEKISSAGSTLIDVSHFPSSIYLIHLLENGKIIGSKKISINH